MSGKRVSVRGYYRSDGTYVKGYTRAAPSSPDTVKVSGYYRSNGTYVEPYIRSAPRSRGSDCSRVSGSCSAGSSGVKCYTDNERNRKLGRVGKPHGTHVLHEDGSVSISKSFRGINRQELEESYSVEELCSDCNLGFWPPTTPTARSTYDDYQSALEREELQERCSKLRGITPLTDVQAPNASCRSRPENHSMVEPRHDLQLGTLGSRQPTTPTATYYDDNQNALYRLEREEVQEHPSRLRGVITPSTNVQAWNTSCRSKPQNHTMVKPRHDLGTLGSRHPTTPTATYDGYQNALYTLEQEEVQERPSRLRGIITPSTDVQAPNASCSLRSKPQNHTVVEPRHDLSTLGSRHPTTPTATYDGYQNALYTLEREEVQERPSRLRGIITPSTDVQAPNASCSLRSKPQNHTVVEPRHDLSTLGSRHPTTPTATYDGYQNALYTLEREEVQVRPSRLRGIITPSTDTQAPNASCRSKPENRTVVEPRRDSGNLGSRHPTAPTASYDHCQNALEREEGQGCQSKLRGITPSTYVQAPNASCRSRPENHTMVEPRHDSGNLESRHSTAPTANYAHCQNALERENVQECWSKSRGIIPSTDVQALNISRSRQENRTMVEPRRDSGNFGSRHPTTPTATYDGYQNALYRLEREEVQERQSKSRGITPSTDVQAPNTSCISRPEKFIPYSELCLDKKIGRGGFGKVYAGSWHGTPIAYKKLLSQQLSTKLKQSFAIEVTVLSMLKHPNTVKMFGVVTEEGYCGIVMEYLVRTLYRAVFKDQTEFTAEKKKQIVSQIASGLAYLHTSGSKEKVIAHRDLKSDNVLLDREDNAKLADFGLSALKNATESSRSKVVADVPGQGTPRYSAPEVLRGEILSMKQLLQADIYSLGVTVFEIVVEEEAYKDLSPRQLEANVGRGMVRPPTDTLSRPVAQLLSSCWNGSDAKSRPTAENFLEEWGSICLKEKKNKISNSRLLQYS